MQSCAAVAAVLPTGLPGELTVRPDAWSRRNADHFASADLGALDPPPRA